MMNRGEIDKTTGKWLKQINKTKINQIFKVKLNFKKEKVSN